VAARFRLITRGLRMPCLVLALGLGAAPGLAETPPAVVFHSRMEEARRVLADEPRFRRLSPHQHQALSEFVVGNMLFVTAHEMGHAVMGEMQIPVLGREEDAADAFATLNALRVGHTFSHGVLVAAAKGWFLSDRQDKKEGVQLTYYERHGLDLQRAYQIVCLMVGSNPEMFKALADETRLPQHRRSSCQDDYQVATWSWETMLKPHLRAADRPKQQIDVDYGDAKDRLDVYARMFRALRFLDMVQTHAGERFAWPRPLRVEMRTCGEANARWSGRTRTLHLCYELANEFAQLYLNYGSRSGAKVRPKR
jgi:Putative metallopeptidase